MIEEVMKKFAVDNAVRLMKSLISYIIEYIKKLFSKNSLKRYMINSCKRKHFNDIHLFKADIVYTFRDSDAGEDIVALDIEYNFKGVAIERINHLLLYYNMKEYNTDNISIEAYDCAGEEERCVRTRLFTQNGGEAFGDNGAYWVIPFYDRNPGHMDPISTKVILRWKRFCVRGSESTRIIIDPRNYSKNIDDLTITVKNESNNSNVEYIKLSEYNRRKRKLDKNGMECDIYNIENSSDKCELVKSKKLLDDGVNENNVFLMEMKFKKCQ